MTREQLDTDTFAGDIDDTDTESLEVKTATADTILILIDNGSTGVSAATYDMQQDIYTPEFDDYQLYDEITGETARSWKDSALGAKTRVSITNKSGSTATYRITLRSFKDI